MTDHDDTTNSPLPRYFIEARKPGSELNPPESRVTEPTPTPEEQAAYVEQHRRWEQAEAEKRRKADLRSERRAITPPNDSTLLEYLAEVKNRWGQATHGKWVVEGGDQIQTSHEVYIAQTTYEDQSWSLEHNVNADALFMSRWREHHPPCAGG